MGGKARTLPHVISSLTPLPARVLVGVSGGMDSCALLQALVQCGREVSVAHFDHGWRTESKHDADFVRELARAYDAPCFVGRAKRGTKRTENDARDARYVFFERVAKKSRCPDLVLAHHERDQAETLLLQLFRGGGSGARGMRPKQNRGGLTVHRPWLTISHNEIVAYAAAHDLQWREDATNADDQFLRNKIRLRLLPLLETEIRPDIVHRLAVTAQIAAEENDWLESLVPKPALRLSVRNVLALPVAGQRRLLRRWLQEHVIADIGFAEVEALRRLLTERTPAKINLPGNRHARRTAGELWMQ
jgi:tRNA(Ile)-lysidine synthase